MARTQIATLKGPRGFTGARGLPGLNAEATDAGVGAYVAAPESVTGTAVRTAATDVWKAQTVAPSNAPYVQLSPAVGAMSTGAQNVLVLKSNAPSATDDGTRIYVMPRKKVTTSVGGTIKIFGDPFYDGAAYRDLGIYFSQDQNGDTGEHGTGVFYINSKVGGINAGATEYDLKNPDIAFSFQDGYPVAARFSMLGAGHSVFVVGSGKADVAKRSSTVRLEMKGDLAFQGTSRVIRWESVASTTADNLLALDPAEIRVVIGGTQHLRVKGDASLVMGDGVNNIATSATAGFFYMRATAGTPTGTPTSYPGSIPLVVDGVGSKLWARIGGVWKSVTFA